MGRKRKRIVEKGAEALPVQAEEGALQYQGYAIVLEPTNRDQTQWEAAIYKEGEYHSDGAKGGAYTKEAAIAEAKRVIDAFQTPSIENAEALKKAEADAVLVANIEAERKARFWAIEGGKYIEKKALQPIMRVALPDGRLVEAEGDISIEALLALVGLTIDNTGGVQITKYRKR